MEDQLKKLVESQFLLCLLMEKNTFLMIQCDYIQIASVIRYKIELCFITLKEVVFCLVAKSHTIFPLPQKNNKSEVL